MDGPRGYHPKSSQEEKEILSDITCMWNLKQGTDEPIFKTETDSQRTDLWLLRGEKGGRRAGSWGLVGVNYYIKIHRMGKQDPSI